VSKKSQAVVCLSNLVLVVTLILFFLNQSIVAESIDPKVLESHRQYYAELKQEIANHHVLLAKKALTDESKIAN
jgi:hypothetical protein